MTSSPGRRRADLLAAVSGLLFGLGLAVSGMTRPAKVTGFLDVFGAWDASLAFVMVGAIGVYAVAYRVIRRRETPLFDRAFHVTTRSQIDLRLVVGAMVFGLGWGLGGFCPGPGIVTAGAGMPASLVFLGGMVGGLLLAGMAPSSAPAARDGA